MPRKQASMTLVDYRATYSDAHSNEFKIEKIKNSTEFIAGDYISKVEVDRRIQAGWDVTIVPYKRK